MIVLRKFGDKPSSAAVDGRYNKTSRFDLLRKSFIARRNFVCAEALLFFVY